MFSQNDLHQKNLRSSKNGYTRREGVPTKFSTLRDKIEFHLSKFSAL